MEDLLFWAKQVLGYLNLKRLSIGLNLEEERLLSGLRGAIDKSDEEADTTSRIRL